MNRIARYMDLPGGGKIVMSAPLGGELSISFSTTSPDDLLAFGRWARDLVEGIEGRAR